MAKLTEKQELLIELLFNSETGLSPSECAKKAGYPSLSQAMQSKALTKVILENTQKYLAINGPRAAMSLMSIIDEPDKKGAAHSIAAAKEVLDRGGLVKKDLTTEEQTQTNVIIQLPKQNED